MSSPTPPCRHLKNQSCFRPGSAFEVAAFQAPAAARPSPNRKSSAAPLLSSPPPSHTLLTRTVRAGAQCGAGDGGAARPGQRGSRVSHSGGARLRCHAPRPRGAHGELQTLPSLLRRRREVVRAAPLDKLPSVPLHAQERGLQDPGAFFPSPNSHQLPAMQLHSLSLSLSLSLSAVTQNLATGATRYPLDTWAVGCGR
jgi:hypothetical protein